MEQVNEYLKKYQPVTVVGGSVVGTALIWGAYNLYSTPWEEIKSNVVGSVLKGVKAAGGDGYIKAEAEKIKAKLRKELHKDLGYVYVTIPEKGVNENEVLSQLENFRQMEEKKSKEGWVSGCVYLGEKDFGDFLNKVYCMYSSTNALHPDIWPSLRKFESEIVAMSIEMLNGGPDCCGLVTSGGTESLVMAVKTYRDWAAAEKGITRPEMVVPITAHAAFDKAASYLKIKVHWCPVGKDMKVDVVAMEKLINSNTIMVVGSAPEYAHGIVDDIAAIGALAKKYKLGCHVDGCLGGFLLPWFKKLGYNIPPFDFSVEGVTSMSADSHKFGYAQKGSSVLLYSHPSYRKYQWFCTVNWPGGIYCSPSFQGSRPGGIIAATWAAMIAMGKERYLDKASKIYASAMKIKAGIPKIPGIYLLGDPMCMVVSWGSDELNIFAVNDKMAHKGWSLNPLHRPNGMHICVTNRTIGREEDLLRDLAEAVEEVRKDPAAEKEGNAPVYGLAATFPDRGTVSDLVAGYLDVLMEIPQKLEE